jgi:hypothetical protein
LEELVVNVPKSGVAFARIVSLDNLKVYRGNLQMPQPQRFTAALAILQSLGNILAAYGSVSTKDRLFDSELVELMRDTLEVSKDIIQLGEGLLASQPTADQERDARAKGREQMSEGMATIVTGCLTTLTEKDSYRQSELLRLAETLETTLPSMIAFLPAGTQQEIPVLVQRMIEQEPNAILKERITRISTALHNAKPP